MSINLFDETPNQWQKTPLAGFFVIGLTQMAHFVVALRAISFDVPTVHLIRFYLCS